MTAQPDPPALLPTHLEHFRLRVLQHALLEATTSYWTRRAAQFDQVGNPACDEVAQACRHHATLLREYGLDAEANTVIDDIAGTLFTQATP